MCTFNTCLKSLVHCSDLHKHARDALGLRRDGNGGRVRSGNGQKWCRFQPIGDINVLEPIIERKYGIEVDESCASEQAVIVVYNERYKVVVHGKDEDTNEERKTGLKLAIIG